MEVTELKKVVCESFCTGVELVELKNNFYEIETPFFFPDGDPYQIFLKEESNGEFKISDGSHTLMQISYETSLENIFKGTRKALLDNVLSSFNANLLEGELYISSSTRDLSNNLVSFGQLITRIYDLIYLDKGRVTSTFYEDLRNALHKIVPGDVLFEDYYHPSDTKKQYPIDYCLKTKNGTDVFLYGVNSKEKARLTTICYQHYLLADNIEFAPLVILDGVESVPKNDLERLINVGGNMISNPSEISDLARKLKSLGMEVNI